MKVLLPVDGSDYTQRALQYLVDHRPFFGAAPEYLAVTVVPHLPGDVTRFVSAEVVHQFYVEESDKVLCRVGDFAAAHGLQMSLQYRIGHPAQAIAELTNEVMPDLLVMGTHGRSALAGVVLGSVAAGVLARTRVPVLLVR
jgi:nucleotide-binding universal stress UspA family protein